MSSPGTTARASASTLTALGLSGGGGAALRGKAQTDITTVVELEPGDVCDNIVVVSPSTWATLREANAAHPFEVAASCRPRAVCGSRRPISSASALPSPRCYPMCSPARRFGRRPSGTTSVARRAGWMLMLPKDVAGHPGAGSGFSASLIVRPGLAGPGGGQPWVVLTNRQVLVEPVNERLALLIT